MKIIKEIGRNPNVDWITILVVSVIVTAVLGFFGYSLYNAVTHGTIQGEDAQASTSFKKLNEKGISSVIDLFADREEARGSVSRGYTRTTDPSI